MPAKKKPTPKAAPAVADGTRKFRSVKPRGKSGVVVHRYWEITLKGAVVSTKSQTFYETDGKMRDGGGSEITPTKYPSKAAAQEWVAQEIALAKKRGFREEV